MDKLRELFRIELKNAFGARIADGKCMLCGAKITDNAYCDCFEAENINRYYKKTNEKISALDCLLTPDDFKAHKKNLLTQSKIPAKFRGRDFKSYKTDIPEQKKVCGAVVAYHKEAINSFLTGKNLILTGNYGTGKTLLMAILSNRLILDFAFRCRHVNAVDLINEIKESFKSDSKNSTSEILNRHKKADFLFLDDIDKLNATEYVREFMYGLVNYRTENELPTVISANSPIEVLDERYFGEATVSRLLENSREVRFTHKNMRYE